MKKVSVIIPVYNMGNKISECLNTVLQQTYKNIEVILVDDGSQDDSLPRCLAMAAKNPGIKVFHTANRGSGPARNYGIERATGDYAYFPDADDLIEPGTIEYLVQKMAEDECDLIVFGYKKVDDQNRLIGKKIYADKIFTGQDVRTAYERFGTMSAEFGIQGAPWNKFFDLHVIKKFGIEYPDLRRHQDEVFISRYMEHAEKVCFTAKVFYTYFTNDLKKVWDKYPNDYFDIVIALRQYRKETIESWNPNNRAVRDILDKEYICNVIRALELSFSKKMGFGMVERMHWLQEKTQKADLQKIFMPEQFNLKYESLVLDKIHKRKYAFVYILLALKVFAKKNLKGSFTTIKRLLKS